MTRVRTMLAFAAAVLLLSFAGTAHAALIEADLFAPGDKLITRDTATRLEWLDVPATLGLSYNQAEASTFGTDLGFRHANQTELSILFQAFGITDFSASFQNENMPGARNLIDTMGPGRNTGNFDALDGYVDYDPINPNRAALATVDAAFISPGARVSLDGRGGVGDRSRERQSRNIHREFLGPINPSERHPRTHHPSPF